MPVSLSSDHSLVTEVTDPHPTESTNTAVTDEISSTHNVITATTETDATIPGM